MESKCGFRQSLDSTGIHRRNRGCSEGQIRNCTHSSKAGSCRLVSATRKHTNALFAGAGGQQAPILAAIGAIVTVFDNSPKQLEQDRMVAERDGLDIQCVEGDMADLSRFDDASFDLIFHPCSNTFVSNVIPVWRECFRVLKPGGTLLSGFTNPVRYIFDDERKENGNLEVRYKLPYSDLDHIAQTHIQRIIQNGDAMEFGHTLDDQIGGQLAAGFLLGGFYEDRYADEDGDPISQFMPTFIATRAIKH